MKRRVRLLLATAMGAAVLFAGTSVSAAAAMADDFTGDASASASIPLQNDVEGVVTLNLKDPSKVSSVTGSIEPPGKAAKTVTFDFRTGDTAATQKITGKWPISKDDPAGDWKLSVVVARDTGTNTTPFVVKVAGKQGITGAKVSPDPVQLVKGKDVQVSVEASVKDATTVSAKLVSRYRGSTYFADNSTPGEWTLEVYAHKGGETLKGVAGFTVVAPEGGASKKTKTRVTIAAPNKVTKGKTFKVYGKVYRGTKAYKGKTVEVYFKAKGTKTYKLLGFAKASSTGKYAKTYKAKKDGYFRVRVPGTTTTRSSLSPQEFVDVR
jgi:nitrogen fixation protein FixH